VIVVAYDSVGFTTPQPGTTVSGNSLIPVWAAFRLKITSAARPEVKTEKHRPGRDGKLSVYLISNAANLNDMDPE